MVGPLLMMAPCIDATFKWEGGGVEVGADQL